jgi:hypothetical protein
MKLTDILDEKEKKIEINYYCEVLKNMNNILQILSSDLKLYLNEMYIIDVLIEVIDLQNLKEIKLTKIVEIRKNLRDFAQNKNTDIKNFEKIYNSFISKEIKNETDKKYYKKYYDTLKYLCFIEINKISDTDYRCKILEYILKEKEIIKRSNDIFDILLKKYISLKTGEKGFKKNLSYISKDNNKICSLIDKNLMNNENGNYLALSETLLYYFEKNSIIYLKKALYDIKKPILLDNEPLDIFIEYIKFLGDCKDNPKKIEKEKKLKKHIKALLFRFY